MGRIVCLTGAGGKTALIHRLAKEAADLNEKVLLSTTTKMLAEPETDLSCDAETLLNKLKKDHLLMAGKRDETVPEKFGMLPEAVFTALSEEADTVLLEADGAKHFGVKFPDKTKEPVLPENTDEVIVIMGAFTIGAPCREAVFRYPLFAAKFPEYSGEDAVVTREMLLRIMKEVYEPLVLEKCPKAKMTYLLSRFEENALVFESVV